ncbi:MAG: hypothetical protein JO333_08430 [Verrucomicrobia bacterium]|nr:hypothetical protein [Verrucomicrobiota bacterium]
MISLVKGIDKYVLGALIAFQMALCYNFYRREIAWYPPGNDDQSGYLVDTYRTKEQILTNGFGQLGSVVRSSYNTGIALPILGAVSSLCFAGGRLPVLLVPFLGFVLLQVCAFVTGQTVWRSRTYGYLLLGLILCLNTPWYWAGGLFDFRFDFMAYSLYGIWACIVMRSELFLNRRWALVCGFVGAFLVLTRFLTLLYLLGVSVGFGVVCVAIALLQRGNIELARRMWRRICNLGLSVGILGSVVAPFLISSWRKVFQYYGVGHVLGSASSARAHQGGLDSLVEHLLFYPTSILRDHWGVAFLLGAAIAIIGSWIVALTKSQKTAKVISNGGSETFTLQVIFLLGAILGPILVLTIDTDKNSVVSGIVGVPVALLIVAFSAHAAAVRDLELRTIPKTLVACSLAVFAIGVGTVLDRLTRHTPEYSQRSDLTRLVELNKWMVSYAGARGWQNPGISFNAISPWFNGYSVTDTGYEEMGKFVEFHPIFGSDIMGAGRQEALSQLAQSDFFILTTPTSRSTGGDSGNVSPNTSDDANYQWLSVVRRLNPHFNPVVQPAPTGILLEGSTAAIQRWPAIRRHLYPFYQRIAEYRDDLKAWADKNMSLAQTVPFENFTVAVYVRPSAPASGLSDNAR